MFVTLDKKFFDVVCALPSSQMHYITIFPFSTTFLSNDSYKLARIRIQGVTCVTIRSRNLRWVSRSCRETNGPANRKQMTVILHKNVFFFHL